MSPETPTLEEILAKARRAFDRTIVAAKYAGHCIRCRIAVHPGDPIAWRKGAAGVFCRACWEGHE